LIYLKKRLESLRASARGFLMPCFIVGKNYVWHDQCIEPLGDACRRVTDRNITAIEANGLQRLTHHGLIWWRGVRGTIAQGRGFSAIADAVHIA
jgi:hypothetical protein